MSNPIHEIREILGSVDFYDACPDCRGKCCNLPWMPKEECGLIKLFAESVEKIGNTNFFLDRRKCKFLDENSQCTIYDLRPMDCRLYPLDII